MNDSLLDAFRLDDQVAVVTGGANGIGRATCEVLAAAGATVVVADVDAGAAEDLARQIDGTATALDVRDPRLVEAAFVTALTEHGRIDVVCNVAGVPAARGDVVDVTELDLARVIDVNLKGTFYCCQAAVRAMVPAGRGCIVNVASSIIDIPAAGNAVYAMTKAGIAMLTRVLADEVGPHGIRVNVVAPGPTMTDFTRHNVADEDGTVDPGRWASFVDRMGSISPLGQVGEPIDQALLILYLVSPAARLATGNVFRVNGGVARPG